MGLIKYLTAVLQMTTAYDTPYQARLRPAGKPTGRGNNTPLLDTLDPRKRNLERES